MLFSNKTPAASETARAVSPAPFDTYVIEVMSDKLDPAQQRMQLKRVFGSALGAQIREATLCPFRIHFTFDAPAKDMKATLQRLLSLIPGATINQIYPRAFEYVPRRTK